MISHALWRDRFGGDPGVLDRQIHLNDRAFAIVGVMPERFAGLSFDTDIWFPSMMVSLTSAPGIVRDRGSRWVGVVGRLADGVTLERAQDDMTRVAGLLESGTPTPTASAACRSTGSGRRSPTATSSAPGCSRRSGSR